MMGLSNETWSLTRLSFQIQNTADTIKNSFNVVAVHPQDRMVRWNSFNHSCHVLNVDSSCLGVPIRAGYVGVIRYFTGFYLSGSPVSFQHQQTSCLQSSLQFNVYSDSLLSIRLLNEHASEYHAYADLIQIQDIKDLLSTRNFSIHHCLREGNQCADFMVKFGASRMTIFPLILLLQMTSYL